MLLRFVNQYQNLSVNLVSFFSFSPFISKCFNVRCAYTILIVSCTWLLFTNFDVLILIIDYFMQFEAREFDRYRRVWANKELEDLVIEYNNTLSMGLSEDDPKLKWPRAFVGLSKQQTSFMCGYNCIGIQGRKVPDEEKLRLALENLKKCDVVTIMEELDAFIPQLRMHVNWVPEKLHHFPKENHHHGKHSVLSDRAKAIVREWASIDMKLYEEAVKIHKKKTELAKKCLVIEEGKGKNDNDDNKAR